MGRIKVKQMISDRFEDIEFSNSVKKMNLRLSVQRLLAKKLFNSCLLNGNENSMESVSILLKGAKLLRKSVLGQVPWEFQGSLNNFHMPNELKTFLDGG